MTKKYTNKKYVPDKFGKVKQTKKRERHICQDFYKYFIDIINKELIKPIEIDNIFDVYSTIIWGEFFVGKELVTKMLYYFYITEDLHEDEIFYDLEAIFNEKFYYLHKKLDKQSFD